MVKDATEEYLNENNPLKTWLWAEFERCDEQDKRYWWSSTDLRDEFLRFSKMEPSLLNVVKFAEAMNMNGITKKPVTNNFIGPVWDEDAWVDKPRKAGSYWIGLRRKTERVKVEFT
jgi:hypothetical protein